MQQENNIFRFPLPIPKNAELEEKLFTIAERLNASVDKLISAAKCASRCDSDNEIREIVCSHLNSLILDLQSDVQVLQPKQNVISLFTKTTIQKGE